jgi:hypothetical protein
MEKRKDEPKLSNRKTVNGLGLRTGASQSDQHLTDTGNVTTSDNVTLGWSGRFAMMP